MNCPICAAALPEGARRCPGCGAELTEYLSAVYQPDLLFNQALDALAQQRHADACALLCQAHALRPDDAGILELWVRSEYAAGNKRRAVELMTDLVELDRSEGCQRRFEALVEEYDREEAAFGAASGHGHALAGQAPAAPPSAAPAVPAAAPKKKTSGFFSGGMPDFSQLSSMFPGKK